MNSTTLLILQLLLATPGAEATPPHAFAAIDAHYQPIRVTLLADSTKDVQAHASSIAKLAEELKAKPSAKAAGVAESDLAAVSALLPEVLRHAKTLAEAEKIEAQREALKALTRPLVRWHEKVEGSKPRLAYCSMERGAWFQPDGVLGNPYGGQRMPRCGVFVKSD